jgi:hypothetical protein
MRLNPTLFETFPRVWTHPVKQTPPSLLKARHLMGSTSRTTEDRSKALFAEYGVETTHINTAPGVELSESQKLLTGSVLDVRNDPSRPCSHGSRKIPYCESSLTQPRPLALRWPPVRQKTRPLDRRRDLYRPPHHRRRQ